MVRISIVPEKKRLEPSLGRICSATPHQIEIYNVRAPSTASNVDSYPDLLRLAVDKKRILNRSPVVEETSGEFRFLALPGPMMFPKLRYEGWLCTDASVCQNTEYCHLLDLVPVVLNSRALVTTPVPALPRTACRPFSLSPIDIL